jgi:hypothetical protein
MLTYCYIATILMNTLRISFTNITDTILQDIYIVGCQTKHLDKLNTGESTTVWVGITGDCAVTINFLANGKRKSESIVSYITNNMGQKIKYNISGKNEKLL